MNEPRYMVLGKELYYIKKLGGYNVDPEPIIINGGTWSPCKWPKIHG